jgi:hypothetical protein
MMDEEWGPWIEHDGKGCPCVGKIVHAVRRDRKEVFCVAGARCLAAGEDPSGPESAWVWSNDGRERSEFVRYRIRRPKALRELIDMVENLPVNAKEDA